jgi:DNA modification methylase
VTWEMRQGDAWALAADRPAEPSAQAIVTSPPYWGQRRYGDHADEFGNEADPEAYVARLVGLFHRLSFWLVPTGALWLNLGDTIIDREVQGIPGRVAQQLRATGWKWRSEVIYERENLTPRGVTGCPLRSHEHVLLFSRGDEWYYDDAAMREPAKDAGYHYKREGPRMADGRARMDKERVVADTRTLRTVWRGPTGWNGTVQHPALMPRLMAERCVLSLTRPGDLVLDPFAGAATTGFVALTHGGRFLGFELVPAFIDEATARLSGVTQGALPL